MVAMSASKAISIFVLALVLWVDAGEGLRRSEGNGFAIGAVSLRHFRVAYGKVNGTRHFNAVIRALNHAGHLIAEGHFAPIQQFGIFWQ